jgi:chitin disaccharide deacetylase
MIGRAQTRHLIVNADEFGQSTGVNRGIVEARENGIVTSASLMVRWPAAEEAAAYAREHPRFSLGLHFDVGGWTYRRGTWAKLYDVVSENDVEQVAKEAGRQLAAFHRLIGRHQHIDTHQHIDLRKSLRPISLAIAEELGVPLRSCNPQIRYWGNFYGQDNEARPIPGFIGVPALIRLIAKLPGGFTEPAVIRDTRRT